jgi:hypothetical protein
MTAACTDVAGRRFGKLQALELTHKSGHRAWLCVCDCGGQKVVGQYELRSGISTSCGCEFAKPGTKHGLSKTPEYRAWINIRGRCENENTPYWPIYGGRGIRVCERWRASFDAFLSDMGPRPSSDHSIDRINVNGNYEPSNCRWATRKQQLRNQRRNHIVEVDGKRCTLVEAVEERGLKYNTVLYRIIRGASAKEALT